jgi:hypothetical protein
MRFLRWLARMLDEIGRLMPSMFGPEMPDWWEEDDPLLSDRRAIDSDWAAVHADIEEAEKKLREGNEDD